MFDLGKKTDRDLLHAAKKYSRDILISTFCVARTEMIRDYVGSVYSKKGSRLYTLVNMMNQTAKIYSMALAFNNPQCKITSFNQKNWPFCRKYETNVNKVVANIDFKTTFQMGVLDAFFMMGIFRVRMADSGYVEIADNVWVNPGQPWMDRISLDDAILDMGVKDIRAMRYCGNRYRAPVDAVQERDDYNQQVRNKMYAESFARDDFGSGRASDISTNGPTDYNEIEPSVWLEDIYVPRTKQIATFWADRDDMPPLKVEDDVDAPMGGYEFLGLGMVPDNIIPSSPAQNLKGLHDLCNRLYRKMSQQAARQKTVWGYAAGKEDDAGRHKNAKDGEYVMMLDPKSITPSETPGVDGNTNAFFVAAQEVYNIQAGNQRALAGLGSESDTVGQEQMIQNRVTGMIGFMKGAVNDCASRLCRKIGLLMFDDDFLSVDSTMEVENTGRFVDSSWRPGDRVGLKDHYEFVVEPNSMGYQPPEAKLQGIFDYLQRVGTIMPLIQMGVVDLQELTKLFAEYRNQPELMRVCKILQDSIGSDGSGVGGGVGGDPHGVTKAPVTTRETVRRGSGGGNSGGGPSGSGLAAVMGQMMQGNSRGRSAMTAGAM